MQVKEVIETYESCTGQLINKSKCSIMFKGGDPSEEQIQVKNLLGVDAVAFEARYLGLPTPSGRMKGERFQPLKERFTKRMNDFTEKHMSAAAKKVLIKAVGQALPTYTMSVFKLPLMLCNSLTSIIRDFWWGAEKGKRRTAWVAWSDLTMRKFQGGLGFKDQAIQSSTLGSTGLEINSFPRQLVCQTTESQIFSERFTSGHCVSGFQANASSTWQAVMHGLELLKKGIIWRIGNGSSVRIWRDPWIPRTFTCRTTTRRGRCRFHWVSDLLNSDGSDWDYSRLLAVFNPPDADVLQGLSFLVEEWMMS